MSRSAACEVNAVIDAKIDSSAEIPRMRALAMPKHTAPPLRFQPAAPGLPYLRHESGRMPAHSRA